MAIGLEASGTAPSHDGALVRGDAVEALQQRLSDPKVVEGLGRLLDRVDSIAFAVEAFEGFVARGETIADSVASTVAELKHANPCDSAGQSTFQHWIERAPELMNTGTKLAAVSQQAHLDDLEASHLIDRLTNPETLQSLNQLLDKLPLIAMVVESLDGFLRRGDTIADNLAGLVHELKRSDAPFDLSKLASLVQSLPKLQEMGEQLLDSGLADEGLPKVIDAGVSMIQSGMLDKDIVAVLGELGRASVHTFVEVKNQHPPPIGGIWAMMRAAKDPDVQKTIGFFFAFAKAFSKHLT